MRKDHLATRAHMGNGWKTMTCVQGKGIVVAVGHLQHSILVGAFPAKLVIQAIVVPRVPRAIHAHTVGWSAILCVRAKVIASVSGALTIHLR